jgi:RNA polymerase sigma factor (sigma-70 family)
MPMLRNQPELLAAFRNGEPRGLEIVYRHYVRAIAAYVRALARRAGAHELGQPSVVQDLLQEIFIRAFSTPARHAYDITRDFGPYLKTIARNFFVDVLRKRKDEIAWVWDDAPSGLDPQLGEQSYDGAVLATLDAYLRQLPPELWCVYEERFERGLSQVAASERLGLSRRSLRTLESHLRRGLRQSLLKAGLLHDAPYAPLLEWQPALR